MEPKRQIVFEELKELDIEHEVTEHPAIHTIEEMDALNLDPENEVPKNLFVRDDKKKRYFIIVLQKHKTANLKDIREKLASRPLSFASEDDLKSIMRLEKGAVTPLGVLNDDGIAVEVVLDKDLLDFKRVGVHPNDNTATLWLKPQDLLTVIKKHGSSVSIINI